MGYTYGTVRRFALEPAFLQRVRELQTARTEEALGRLNAEATLQQARAELNVIFSRVLRNSLDPQLSKERQQALRELIGLWKTEQPPDDEEVERIIEQERMKKYG